MYGYIKFNNNLIIYFCEQKWREERDKLVSGLELVLKQKDTELKEMKKSDGGMQVD